MRKNLFYLGLSLLTMCLLTSCGDDDDDEIVSNPNSISEVVLPTNSIDPVIQIDEQLLYNDWVRVQYNEYLINNGVTTLVDEEDQTGDDWKFILYANHDGHYGYSHQTSNKVVWYYKNGLLIVYKPYETNICTILSLNEEEMKIRCRFGDEIYGGYTDQVFKNMKYYSEPSETTETTETSESFIY